MYILLDEKEKIQDLSGQKMSGVKVEKC